MESRPELLVVDDDTVTCDLLREVLEKEGYSVTTATSGTRALDLAGSRKFELVISDIKMAGMTGIELLKKLKENSPDMPVILITAFGSIETALDAIKSGAADYISKPFRLDEVRSVVGRNLARADRRGDLPAAPAVTAGRYDLGSIIGRSRVMLEVYKTLARVAGTKSTVLITGDSGTGKELIARAIHTNSPRNPARFFPINCSSIPETLLESELFGHVKGAFTGAIASKKGIFEEADGGTCFLDEIGDMSITMQAKLLRFLQDGEVRKVGGSDLIKTDVRIIAATNKDLEKSVKEEKFREDLFYRLNVVRIHLPPLRERREDIPVLIEFFINRHRGQGGNRITSIAPEAVEALGRYNWPGNVRELEHLVELLVATSNKSFVLLEDIPLKYRSEASMRGDTAKSHKTLEEIEREHIEKVLRDLKWNRNKASQALGIDRKTLYRKLDYYKIKAP
jgi:DNA-binding NtrC family response regulator